MHVQAKNFVLCFMNANFWFNSFLSYSVEGWDNPFRPDGDLSKEADQIVELIKEGKPINDETLRSKSPSVNEPMNTTSSSIPTQNQLNVRKATSSSKKVGKRINFQETIPDLVLPKK